MHSSSVVTARQTECQFVRAFDVTVYQVHMMVVGLGAVVLAGVEHVVVTGTIAVFVMAVLVGRATRHDNGYCCHQDQNSLQSHSENYIWV